MNILITHPYCWPYVRRGSERFLSELSDYLVQRGHNVTVLSTSPKGREEEVVGGVRVVREAEVTPPSVAGFHMLRPETGFALVCARFLRQNSFDVIHCLHHADVLGAIWERNSRRTPCVFHITGLPFARWLRRRPWETAMTQAAVRHATRVLLITGFSKARFARLFPRSIAKTRVIPIPCQVSSFNTRLSRRDIERPVILFMGAATELRKGAYPLAHAFNLVKLELPGAQLRYCGSVSNIIRNSILQIVLPQYRDTVQFLGNGLVEDLPGIYSQAAVTVLPSVEESFGMVLVESLASGTPIVGSSDAGMTEIVQPGTGGLFDPQPRNSMATNVAGLAEQLVAVIRLHADSSLAERCRTAAQRFAWQRLGSKYESVYEECVENAACPAELSSAKVHR